MIYNEITVTLSERHLFEMTYSTMNIWTYELVQSTKWIPCFVINITWN